MDESAKPQNGPAATMQPLVQTPDWVSTARVTSARVDRGLRCIIEEGDWVLVNDMPGDVGGSDSAPTPGMFGRGALASCLAIGIKLWAQRLGISLESVEVRVEAESDDNDESETGEDAPWHRGVRRVVNVRSTAPAQAIRDLVDAAERHSPYLDLFARSQALDRVIYCNGVQV